MVQQLPQLGVELYLMIIHGAMETTLNTINNTNSVSNLPAGLISITITDGNGCTATANETILEPTSVSATIGIPTMVTCNGDADGSVTVTGSGGTVAGDYTYLWNNGQTTATATNLHLELIL